MPLSFFDQDALISILHNQDLRCLHPEEPQLCGEEKFPGLIQLSSDNNGDYYIDKKVGYDLKSELEQQRQSDLVQKLISATILSCNLLSCTEIFSRERVQLVIMTTAKRPKADGTWEDCGCPLSLAHLNSFNQDLSTGPHVCLISRDEWRKHYILDRHAYVRACKAPEDSTLGVWVAERLEEGRLFVAKPPQRAPISPEPWRFDEPSFWDLTPTLEPGWRLWQPEDDALHFGGESTELMYDRMLDDFFELLHLEGLLKKLMSESGEAWLLACGEPNQNVRVNSRACLKNDRCFVTADNEFFACISQVLTNKNMRKTIAELLEYVDLGLWMKHMRRITDIRIDDNVQQGGCGHVFNFI